MKYNGIIFDFNGVLLWDSHLHERAWLDLSERMRGSAFSPQEIFNHVHGRPNIHIFEYLLQRSVAAEELHSLVFEKESLYRGFCLQNPSEFQLSPGAAELLDFLMAKAIPHTIATASPKDNLDFFIKHLKLHTWFDTQKIVYDDGTFSGKAEMYLKAAENLRLHPSQCVVIEDSPFGIAAAAKAHMGKVIGLGPGEKQEFLRSLEDINDVITSLQEVERETLFEIY